MKEKLLKVSSSPHLRAKQTTGSVMRDVLIALIPASAVAIVVFGLKALLLIVVGIVSAVLFELISLKMLKRPIAISDGSAAVTGLLLALNMPVNAPWWLVVVGSGFAVIIVKQLFGGIGANFVNPALTARIMLLISWPMLMTTGAYIPASDAVAQSTPLAILEALEYTAGDAAATATATATATGSASSDTLPSILNMFLGKDIYGSIGEISALALLVGGIYLIARNVIGYRIPVFYLGTVALFAAVAGHDVPFQLLAGGLMIGAIFMATDYSTSPTTPLGEIIYAVGCGVITCAIRYYGGYPEGVSFAIVIMNCFTPLLDRCVRIKKYGEVKTNA